MIKAALGLLLVSLFGCVKVGPPTPPLLPPSDSGTIPPTFEKTFGELSVLGPNALVLTYKDMRLVVDPSSYPAPAADVDYLLLTSKLPSAYNSPLIRSFRKDLKILSTEEVVSTLRTEGFSQAKSISPGQRVMLKKNDGFVFVTVMQSRNSSNTASLNGYLLEFDNGKNLFLIGETSNVDAARPFVYDLRDEGKEIHMGLVTLGPTPAPEIEASAAGLIALIQPRNAILLGPSSATAPLVLKIKEQLKTDLFDGAVYVPRDSEKIPF